MELTLHTVICTYVVKPEHEQRFLQLLRRHYATLEDQGLVEPGGTQAFRTERDGAPVYVEIFTWKPGAADRAHELPAVMSVWEPMGACCDAMEFPHYARVALA